jgi:hypothetical protein
MDMHTPNNQDDLSDLERRLSGWRPGVEGLDADAMLYAAGLAAGRRGGSRLVLPAICGVLAMAVVGLAAWGLSEHAERRALDDRLAKLQSVPSAPTARSEPIPPESPYTPSPSAYFTLRRQMEQEPNRWMVSLPSNGSSALEAPPQPDIYKIGQIDRLLAQ